MRDDSAQVDGHLSPDEWDAREYKELRGIAIRERFLEKEARIQMPLEGAEAARTAFRKKFGYENVHGMEDILRRLKFPPGHWSPG